MRPVTADDLRDLLDGADGAALVLEEGRPRVVPAAESAGGMALLTRADLLDLLGGQGADPSEERLRVVAQGLATAVREQGG
jgi:hypothetical protein